jgi:hypothetical protein
MERYLHCIREVQAQIRAGSFRVELKPELEAHFSHLQKESRIQMQYYLADLVFKKMKMAVYEPEIILRSSPKI